MSGQTRSTSVTIRLEQTLPRDERQALLGTLSTEHVFRFVSTTATVSAPWGCLADELTTEAGVPILDFMDDKSESEEEEVVLGTSRLCSAVSIGSCSSRRAPSVAKHVRARKKGMKATSASNRRIAKTIEVSEEECKTVRLTIIFALRHFLRNILKVLLPTDSDPNQKRRYLLRFHVVRGGLLLRYHYIHGGTLLYVLCLSLLALTLTRRGAIRWELKSRTQTLRRSKRRYSCKATCWST